MAHHVNIFHSLDEILDYTSQDPRIPVSACHSRREDSDGPGSWHGTANFEQAVELARHGWSNVRPSIDGLLSDIDGKVRKLTEEKPVMFHDVTGAFVDMGAYMAGEPECMIDVRQETLPTTGRIVRLLVNGSANWSVDEATIKARGAAICALVDAMARQHLALEVWVEVSIKPQTPARGKNAGKSPADRLSTVVRVKAAADPLDIDMLMFPIGHPSFLRRIVFDVEERFPDRIRKKFGIGTDWNGSYYGIPVDSIMAERIGADLVLGEQAHRSSNENTDPAGWIEDCMRQVGVELNSW